MSDSDLIVVQGQAQTNVVVAPQDNVVTSVAQEVAVATVETQTTLTAEVREFHVVIEPPL